MHSFWRVRRWRDVPDGGNTEVLILWPHVKREGRESLLEEWPPGSDCEVLGSVWDLWNLMPRGLIRCMRRALRQYLPAHAIHPPLPPLYHKQPAVRLYSPGGRILEPAYRVRKRKHLDGVLRGLRAHNAADNHADLAADQQVANVITDLVADGFANFYSNHSADRGADHNAYHLRANHLCPVPASYHLGAHHSTAVHDANVDANGSPDFVSDHFGTHPTSNHLRAHHITADRAPNLRAHHFRTHHFWAVAAPDHLGAHHIAANRDANVCANQSTDVPSDRSADHAADSWADHLGSDRSTDQGTKLWTDHVRAHDVGTIPDPDDRAGPTCGHQRPDGGVCDRCSPV